MLTGRQISWASHTRTCTCIKFPVFSQPSDMTHERQKQCVENYKHQRINQVWSILQNSARSLGPTCSSKTEGELPWPGEHTHTHIQNTHTHIQTNTDTGLMSPSCEWLRDTARQQLMWRGGRTCWPTKQRERERRREEREVEKWEKVREMKKRYSEEEEESATNKDIHRQSDFLQWKITTVCSCWQITLKYLTVRSILRNIWHRYIKREKWITAYTVVSSPSSSWRDVSQCQLDHSWQAPYWREKPL